MKKTDFYVKNNCLELKKIIFPILKTKFGWISEKEYDDFISIGAQVVWDCETKFDESKGAEFKTFLFNCLLRKIKTRVTFLNRKKRNFQDDNGHLTTDISLESLIEDNNALIMKMYSVDDYKIEEEGFSCKMIKYLNRLSLKQKNYYFYWLMVTTQMRFVVN